MVAGTHLKRSPPLSPASASSPPASEKRRRLDTGAGLALRQPSTTPSPAPPRPSLRQLAATEKKSYLELLPGELLHRLSQKGSRPLLSPQEVGDLRLASRALNFKLHTGLHRQRLLEQRLEQILPNEHAPEIERFRSAQGLWAGIRDSDVTYDDRGGLTSVRSLSGAEEPMGLGYWFVSTLQRFAEDAMQAFIKDAAEVVIDENMEDVEVCSAVKAVEMIRGLAGMARTLKPSQAPSLLLQQYCLACEVEKWICDNGLGPDVREQCGETALAAISEAVQAYAGQNEAPWMMDLVALQSAQLEEHKAALSRVRQAFSEMPGGVRQLAWDTLAIALPSHDAGERAHSLRVCCKLAERLGASNAPSADALEGFATGYIQCAAQPVSSALRRVVEASPPDKPFARDLAFALIYALPQAKADEDGLLLQIDNNSPDADHPLALVADAALRLQIEPLLRQQALTQFLRVLKGLGETLWLPASVAEHVLGRCLDTLEQRPLDMAWDRADIEDLQLQFVLLRRARPEAALRALDRMLGLLDRAAAGTQGLGETVVDAVKTACQQVGEMAGMPTVFLQQPAVEQALRLIGRGKDGWQPLGQLLQFDKLAASLSAQALEALIAGSLQLLRQTDRAAPADQLDSLWVPLFQLTQALPVRSRCLAAADAVALAYVEPMPQHSALRTALVAFPASHQRQDARARPLPPLDEATIGKVFDELAAVPASASRLGLLLALANRHLRHAPPAVVQRLLETVLGSIVDHAIEHPEDAQQESLPLIDRIAVTIAAAERLPDLPPDLHAQACQLLQSRDVIRQMLPRLSRIPLQDFKPHFQAAVEAARESSMSSEGSQRSSTDPKVSFASRHPQQLFRFGIAVAAATVDLSLIEENLQVLNEMARAFSPAELAAAAQTRWAPLAERLSKMHPPSTPQEGTQAKAVFRHFLSMARHATQAAPAGLAQQAVEEIAYATVSLFSNFHLNPSIQPQLHGADPGQMTPSSSVKQMLGRLREVYPESPYLEYVLTCVDPEQPSAPGQAPHQVAPPVAP